MRRKGLFIGCFLIPFVIVVFSPIIFASSRPSQIGISSSLLYLYKEPHGTMQERCGLDQNVQLTSRTSLPSTLTQYDGLILDDFVLTSEEIDRVLSFLQADKGLFIITGPNLTNDASLLQALNLTTSTVGQSKGSSTLPQIASKNHPLVAKIEWNSVPAVYNTTSFSVSDQASVIIEDSDQNPLIFESTTSNIIVLTIWPEEIHNAEFLQWPYYNYLLRLNEMLIVGVEETNLPHYADWLYSPVPHMQDSLLLGFGVIISVLVTIGGFLYSRRVSRTNPISEEELEGMAQEVKVVKEWEDVGMHRQISGFLVQLFIGMLIILPNVIMTVLVFPLIILPSPQAAGFYDFTIHFFEAIWLVFDLGTSIVLVKFFAEHRVERPQKAVRYIQIFVWYQMLSGVLQLFLISFLGSLIFPRTFLAHMSWVFVTHAFFQWPAFFLVFLLIFRAMNRLDFFQVLNILTYGIFNITLQYLVIVIFRAVLGPNIVFGDSLAGAIGYSVGYYVVQIASFLTGLWMFKRLGFSVRNLFRVDFSLSEIKESFVFGTKWAFGNMWVPLGWFLQVFLIATFIPNYTEQQGFFSIAWGFAQIVMLVGLFAESMLGGISESFHAHRKVLTQYYACNAWKWAAFLDFYLVGALVAIGPRLILGGAGQEWAGAAILIPWLLLFHTFGFLSWLGDWMFAGSDRPGWAAGSWIIEQSIRGLLLLLFIPQYLFFTSIFNSPLVAVMFAYIPALIIKDIYMWFGIRRSEYFQFKWKDLFYQGIIAPIATGISVLIITEIMCSIIWQGDIVTSVIILLLGTFPMIFIASFLFGLLGGFDTNTLAEFKKAAQMAKGVGVLARLMYWAAEKGANISPLHNKFPISIYQEAMDEAQSLTEEKKVLVI